MESASPRSSADDNALSRVVSHGRGGAGNIRENPGAYKETEEDLKIPTLKSPVYTTGRGGTGNMAINDPNHPEHARTAQDVENVVPPRLSGDYHGGRGGAGNAVYLDDETVVDTDADAQRAEDEKARLAEIEAKRDYRGWADRGKDLLMMKLTGRGKKSPSS